MRSQLRRFKQLVQLITYKDWRFRIERDCGSRCWLQVRLGRWSGRKWFLSEHMTDSEVIATAFKAVLTAEEHECRENFRYKGQLVFGPHFDVDALADLLVHEGDRMISVRENP